LSKIVLAEAVRVLKGRNPYEILGFTPSFIGLIRKNKNLLNRLVELHKAYLLAVIHPDIAKEEDKKISEELAKIINEAADRIKNEFEREELIEQYIVTRDLKIKELEEEIKRLTLERDRLQRENEILKDEIRRMFLVQERLIKHILSFPSRSKISSINANLPCLLIVDRGKYSAIYFVDENRKIYEIVGKSRLAKKRLKRNIQHTLEKLSDYIKAGKIKLRGFLIGSSQDKYFRNLYNFSFRGYKEVIDFIEKIEPNLENQYLISISYIGYEEKTRRYYIVFDVMKVEKIIRIKEKYTEI